MEQKFMAFPYKYSSQYLFSKYFDIPISNIHNFIFVFVESIAFEDIWFQIISMYDIIEILYVSI